MREVVTEELLFRHFHGSANEAESKLIADWLESSKPNRQFYATLKKISIDLEANTRVRTGTTDAAYNKFIQRVESSRSFYRAHIRFSNRRTGFRIVAIAAAVMLLVSITLISYFAGSHRFHLEDEAMYVVEVPYGGRSNLVLPDGSKVWLNAGSKLTYSSRFSSRNREVSIEGEAYFDVEKNNHPFVVKTSHLDIQVLGTTFNVKSYPDEDKIETTLVEGEIKIKRKESKQLLIMNPREKLTYHKASSSVKIKNTAESLTEVGGEFTQVAPDEQDTSEAGARIEIREDIDPQPEVSWKDGDLIFSTEPLSELAKKLERKYDVQFIFLDQELKTYSYSGTLRDVPLEQVLNALELTSPVRYKIDGRVVQLTLNDKFVRQH